MNEFAQNITIVTRYYKGTSNTYFVYIPLEKYLKSLTDCYNVDINEDGSYSYETTWESFEISNYEHRLNHELKLEKDIIEEFAQRFAIFKCREFIKELNCDYLIPDFVKHPK